MDFPDLSSILKQFTLGVSLGEDALHLSLLSRHWKRLRRVDRQTVGRFDRMPSTERLRQVQAFLKRNEVTHCNVVLSLPRREVLVRELELPAEAGDNLAKVLEYQMVNLLPSEEQAVSYDYLAAPEASKPPRLRATVFVVLQSTLERYLGLCRDLGLSLDRIVPQGVAVANYVRSAAPKAGSAASLIAVPGPGGGELVGLAQGQLRLCKEYRSDGPGLAQALENEVDLFRGEARLAEETPVELFLAGEDEALSEAGGRLRPRAVPLPRAAVVRRTGPADRDAGAHWPALAAAFCGFKQKDALEVNLLPVEQRVRKPRWEMLPTYALLAANGLLLLALLFRGPVQQAALSEELSRERERLQPAVTAVRKLEAQADHWRGRAGLLSRHKHRNRALLAALADLSLILPEDSMLSLFNLQDGVIRIQGTSGQAAALPQILEDSRYFKEVELVSGITRNAEGRESYRIQARLEAPLSLRENSDPPEHQPPPASGDAPREVNP